MSASSNGGVVVSCDVGIGRVSPQAKLDVGADILINGLTLGRGAGDVANNTAFGRNALQANTTGNQNCAIGQNAQYSNTEGTNNTALGLSALLSNITGSNSTALGQNALYNNTGNLNTCLLYTSPSPRD